MEERTRKIYFDSDDDNKQSIKNEIKKNFKTIIRAKQLLKLNIKKLKPRYHKNIYKINDEKIEPECKIEAVTFLNENNIFEIPLEVPKLQPMKNNFIQNQNSNNNNLISNQIINNNSLSNNKSLISNNKIDNNIMSNNYLFNDNNSKDKVF